MALYRSALPQLGKNLFLTDGGMETTLIFRDGVDLPEFATFPLLNVPDGAELIRNYYRRYLEVARQIGSGLILDSVTWRANARWGAQLGYTPGALAECNRAAIALLENLRAETGANPPLVISGCIGPRGDGYRTDHSLTEAEAAAYHREQINTLADTAADMICAMTMNSAVEATGIARACKEAGMPLVLSFTVETDSRLPSGQPLLEAIDQVDTATGGYPAYYMINCAHPTHFSDLLTGRDERLLRIRGIRANASRQSHAELDESIGLDDGDPVEFGALYAALKRALPHLTVIGGCCGTDHRHVSEAGKACAPLF